MSTIERMTIQGIRSYGPKDKDTQRIDFFTPVTLIVGQNGCGKTTIIESLKYATTSDMPPNTKGTSFLFDPKLIDEIETKAKIALFFRDMNGLCIQVQKNLCSTQKLKKLEFRTLETIITRYNAENKIVSTITSKCINADAEVVNAFGVSKAVLEHVIFCHQEDSNWPLSDGKLLKTRFDEIFAATKYIKALEILKKVRLEKTHKINEVKLEKGFLEKYKNNAEKLTAELELGKERKEKLLIQKGEIDEKLKPLQAQIDKFLQESNQIFEIKNEMEKIQNEKALLEKQMKELILLTQNCMFQGTEEQLRQMIEEMKSTTIQMLEDEVEEINDNQDNLYLKQKELNDNKTKLHLDIGQIENKIKNLLSKKKDLADLAKKACKIIKLDPNELFTEAINPNNFDRDLLNKFFEEFLEKNELKVSILEKNASTEEDMLQHEINEQRDEKSRLDQNIVIKEENISKARHELERLNSELKQVSDDKLITKLDEDINLLDLDLSKKSDNLIDSEKLKQEIIDYEKKQTNLKLTESDLDGRISNLHLNSKVKTEIDLLVKDKTSKCDEIRKIKMRNQEEIETFFEGERIEDVNLKSSFEKRLKNLTNEISTYKNKQKDIERRLITENCKRQTFFDDLRGKEAKLRECEDKLLEFSECFSSSEDIDRFDEINDNLEKDHKNVVEEKGFLTGVDKTYNRFLLNLEERSLKENQDSSCPICMRCFKNQDELDETIRELKKSTSRMPQKITELEVKIKSSKTILEKLRSLKPERQLYNEIKNGELKKVRKELDNYDKNVLPKLKIELKTNEEQLKKLENLKTCSENIQNEVVLIDKYLNECKDLERKINEKQKSDTSLSQNQSLETLEAEKESTKFELNSLSKLIKQKQEEISSHYDKVGQINNLKEKINQLTSQKNDLQVKFQKKNQLIEKRDDLMKECKMNEKQIANFKIDLDKAISKMNTLIEEKRIKMARSSALVTQQKKELDELKALHSKISDSINDITKFEKSNDLNDEKLKKELKSLDKEEKKVKEEIEKCRDRLDDIKTNLARHELKKRELQDNLALRQKGVEHKAKQEQYNNKKKELPIEDLDGTLENYRREQRKAQTKYDELTREKIDIKTKVHELDGFISAKKQELDQDVHNNALEKYMNCAADLRVLEVCVTDIEKYYKALDKAIMNYHNMKMSEINKTIKQLWRQVYRGNDIDYIEIRSEEDSPNSEQAEVVSRRKTYNYRVVLVKGDTAMDMRGRCSAGQKVLASIIIRLSLAENFCLNSGILALDEPTTNLDRENIESLASALVEIIKARSNQKNFQLLIITHDEDFVEMLGRSEYMDQFYRVTKDDK